MHSHTEYVILENIYDFAVQNEPIRQRDLAQIAGASLGMTNSILKRLAEKGWITIKRLNSRNIQYAITIEGINEIVHRSYRYFKRTIRNIVYYRETLENLIGKAAEKNINTVILVGKSDLDFIIEHACHRRGLNFKKTKDTTGLKDYPQPKILKIYSESINNENDAALDLESFLAHNIEEPQNIFYLSRLIIQQRQT